MAGRPGHDPSDPAHAPLMTGVAAACRHHAAVDHSRSAEGCRGLVTHITSNTGWKVVRRLRDNSHSGIGATMTGRAGGGNSRVAHSPG